MVGEISRGYGAFYFGCWEQPGHYFWLPWMRWYRAGDGEPRYPTPWGSSLDSKYFDRPEWRLLKKDGWTAVGRLDQTVDSRPGSHGVFAFHADLSMEQALDMARAVFPAVFARMEPATVKADRLSESPEAPKP